MITFTSDYPRVKQCPLPDHLAKAIFFAPDLRARVLSNTPESTPSSIEQFGRQKIQWEFLVDV